MLNAALYKKEFFGSLRLLAVFGAVLTLYITMIIRMYDPEMAQALAQFEQLMPELMSAVGMTGVNDSLMDFMISYLYGMLLLVFPMVYTILRANALVAKYVDRGSMALLLASPVRRTTVALTQLSVLVTGITALTAYCTLLEMVTAHICFPGELAVGQLLRLNGGLWCLQLCIGGFCFLCSCLFGDARYSAALGAGVPCLMYVLQMLANMGGKLEGFRYATVFTLFQPQRLTQGNWRAGLYALVLLTAAVLLFAAAAAVFRRRDLHI